MLVWIFLYKSRKLTEIQFLLLARPPENGSHIVLFFSCLLIALLTDMEFCMKIVWFIVINVFFLCWPIASRYPRYRYLVSPFRWAFWDIPSYRKFLSLT